MNRRRAWGVCFAAICLWTACGYEPPAWGAEPKPTYQDPELTIPACKQPPVIDGKLSPGEWDFAAAVSMLEAYPCYWPRAMRLEQPVFFVFRDADHLYIAMESLDSNTTGIIGACVMHDNMRIIGDDCVELMLAPGAGDEIKQYDFPTFYWAINSLGTVWDAKFVPLLAETHNSWESGIEVANGVEGTHWVCEIRMPLAAIRREPPADGTVWRMNFDRTYSGYHWSAWNASGGLNDCRVGGNVTFDSQAPAIRLMSVKPLVDAQLQVVMQVANATDKPRTVKLAIDARGTPAADGEAAPAIGTDSKAVTVAPGETQEVLLGRGERLLPSNVVTVKATDEAGKILYSVERQVNVPSPWFAKKPAPKVPLVSVLPRFLPSLERLAVIVDYTAWARKAGPGGDTPTVQIDVWRQGEPAGEPVLKGELREFQDCRGVWRGSTKDLPEGDYVVKATVRNSGGDVLVEHDDWFEKKIFDWMQRPRGQGDAVPAPYTALEVKDRTVTSWGRVYAFDETGLPTGMESQGRQLLTGRGEWLAEVDGRPATPAVTRPFAFTDVTPGEVRGRSTLTAGNLKMELESVTEYDGFTLFRLTYGPEQAPVTVQRLRLKLPIAVRHAKFYSAAGDTQGTCIHADLLPDRPGKLYDSLDNTRSVCCSPTFASCLWVGDHDVCLTYAADSDKGWLIRDDAPAVEAWREGETLTLWLNLVDKEYTLTEPRTLEFALQAGPTKPLPDGWRGIQDTVHPAEGAPLQLVQVGGSGNAMPGGGQCFIHPGVTPEEQERSRQYLESKVAGGGKAVIGYTYWPMVPKGFPETRVFRGEWGIDKQTWESRTGPEAQNSLWKSRFFGENKERYIFFDTHGVPSYVDFLTYAYDLALTHTPICGTYDDCGYPKPVYDEELGLGFVREDGRKVYSSGLWAYRERWKRAAYVNFLHGRPNFLADSQHCHAHYLPAYHFIGLWRPCERGYYNPFKDRDNLEFYGSLERYAAYNPSKAFGQVGQIGMSSPQSDPALKARDTRSMMMLAMLNDQDLGSWNAGGRDSKVIGDLRRARNGFAPWEASVTFLGYWENADQVKGQTPSVRVSVYQRPDRLLLVCGNVGSEAVTAAIEPAWAAFKLPPAGLKATDAETGEAIPLSGGFKVDIARHDLRLVLIEPAK